MRPRLLALLLVMLLLAACSAGEEGPSEVATQASTPGTGLGVPEVPVPTEPGVPSDASVEELMGEPEPVDTTAPVPGEVVLVHLEGPVDNREATDVVVRTEQGEEVDRFRLPGAVGLWAGHNANHAIIHTLPGGWARYDAVDGTLTVVPFPEEPPEPTVSAGSGIAGPTAVWDPAAPRWLLRMDTGEVTDLEPLLQEPTLETLTGDGEVALLRDAGEPVLLDTSDVELRRLGAEAAALSGNGLVVATRRAVEDGNEIAVEAVDGQNLLVLGVIERSGTPIPLTDSRVLMLGPDPGVLGVDGEVTDLDPAVPLQPPARVSADGRVALARSGDGLALVDLAELSAQPVPDSDGFGYLMFGPSTMLWAISTDPAEPGVVMIDPETGQVRRFLEQTPTRGFTSVSADGREVTVDVGPGRGAAVQLEADGTETPMLEGEEGVRAHLHPGGRILAVTRSTSGSRSLIIDTGDEVVEVDTGRSPAWLTTVDS